MSQGEIVERVVPPIFLQRPRTLTPGLCLKPRLVPIGCLKRAEHD